MTKTAKIKIAKIQLTVTTDMIAGLIKKARKNNVDWYAKLTPANAAAAIAFDAQVLCDKTADAVSKASGNDAAQSAAVLRLLDNARSLKFKSAFNPAKEESKAAKVSKVTKTEKIKAKDAKPAKETAKIKAKIKDAKPAKETAKIKAKDAKPAKETAKIKAKSKPTDKAAKAGKAAKASKKK